MSTVEDGVIDPGTPPEENLAVVRRLLAMHPSARLVALNELGIFVPMPPTVPITSSQQVIEGHSSAVELVAADEILAVVDAWHHARAYGRAEVDVHPHGSPAVGMTLHFFDVSSDYGCFLGIVVGEGADLISQDRYDGDVLRPRLMVVRQDDLGHYRQVDEASPFVLGYPDMVGTRSIDLIHPDDAERAVGVWIEMLGRPGCSRRMRLRHLHLDGRWLWFEVTLRNLLDDPAEHCVVTEMIDISDEMAAHEHVVAQETLLRRLTDSLPMGIVQVDSRGGIVHRNPQINRLLGHPEAQTLDELLVDVADSDASRVARATAQALAEVDSDVEVSVVRGARAEVRRFQLILRSLPDAAGGASGFIFCVSDVTEPARLRDQLHHRATFDTLTGCHNRTSAVQELERMLAASEPGSGVGVLFLDLDGFKQVNDRRGHAAGDALLADLGHFLRTAVRSGDVVGRLGGDEFLILYTGTVSAEQAMKRARRLTAALSAAFAAEPPHGAVASVGVAWLPSGQSGTATAEALISRADSAMYCSKARGDGGAVMFEPAMADSRGDEARV